MKNVLSFFTLFTLSFILFSACSKEENLSKTELIVNDWIYVSQTVDPAISFGGVSISDLLAQEESCSKDDLVSFKKDGNYTIEEGLTKCEDSDPQVFETGKWQLNSDETVLVLTDSDGSVTEANLVTVSKSELEINYEELEGGITYTFSIKLKAN